MVAILLVVIGGSRAVVAAQLEDRLIESYTADHSSIRENKQKTRTEDTTNKDRLVHFIIIRIICSEGRQGVFLLYAVSIPW